jgi:hypothetical protein
MVDHNAETRDRSEEARSRPIEINAKRARGIAGRSVLYVLIAATALIVVAFLVIYFVFLKVAP